MVPETGSRAALQDLLHTSARLYARRMRPVRAKAAPDVVKRALNGLLIHREKLTDAHFSVRRIALAHTGVNRVRRNKKRVDEIMATVLRRINLYDRGGGLALSAANRLCSRNWRAGRLLKPAMTPVFIYSG
ncbi:hypothetical protein KCP76_18395 [Salmonella enterica subsp. enterica serovar Weltevreden]|nr:hypothetical protein KCP76_18395 [Salmonella enterica subsp. enterica serovar Weltevreden]